METKTESYINFLKKQPLGFLYQDQNSSHKQEELNKLKSKYKSCTKCPLATQGRQQIVFGQGNANTSLMFVGEAPGRDEDNQGVPFIGRAGKLLTKMIEAMEFKRDDIYISNVVKCRPPNNRTPLPDERNSCKKLMLLKEIEIIKPKVICCLGASAMKALIGDETKISQARGKFFDFHGTKVVPTFHPAYLLRNPSAKSFVWEDLKSIILYLKNN